MEKGFSFAAGLSAVITAFLAGVLVSLSIRPAGQPSRPTEIAGARQSVQWRVPSAFNTNLPIVGEMPLLFSNLLDESSGGALKLTIFDPGELVPALAISDAVRQGKVEAGMTWLGYDQGWLPASALLASVPFGMEPWEFLAWWYEAGGRQLGEELYAQQGIHLELCGVSGAETAGWFRTPIDTLEDLKGLKIRFSGLGGNILQNLGASVTLISAGEIFQALEKGAIDATEFSMPVIDAKLGFDRVAKYNYFPGWHQPSSSMHLLINADRWRALDPTSQANIQTVCAAISARTIARSESLQGAAIADFERAGVHTNRLPEPMLQALREESDRVLAAAAAQDEWFGRILASQQAFRSSYQKWKQLGYLPRDF